MPRATEDAVKKIVETKLDLSQFLETANMMVEEQLEDKGMSEDRLSKIANFLTAHFVTLQEPSLKKEKYGDSEDEFMGMDGSGLMSSRFGQAAIDLDLSGTLRQTGHIPLLMEVL